MLSVPLLHSLPRTEHVALACLLAWLIRQLAGIAPPNHHTASFPPCPRYARALCRWILGVRVAAQRYAVFHVFLAIPQVSGWVGACALNMLHCGARAATVRAAARAPKRLGCGLRKLTVWSMLAVALRAVCGAAVQPLARALATKRLDLEEEEDEDLVAEPGAGEAGWLECSSRAYTIKAMRMKGTWCQLVNEGLQVQVGCQRC